MDPGNLSGPRLLALSQDIQNRIAGSLRGFYAPSDSHQNSNLPTFKVRVPWGQPLDPWAIRFFAVDVIGGQDIGRAEKQAWAVPIVMDDYLIWFAFRKLGGSATVHGAKSPENASDIVSDCLRRMNKAVPIVFRELIDPLIVDAIQHGAFTIPNRFIYLRDMHLHFRSLSEGTATKAMTAEPLVKALGDSGHSTHYVGATLARQAEFEATAALFAFFSLLEHTLTIGLTFIEYDPITEPFSDFMRMTWSEKFKRVIGLHAKDEKNIYDILHKLADGLRNPMAHGGMDRKLSSIHVHPDNYGAVPTQVNTPFSQPTFTFEPELPKSVFPFADHHFVGSKTDGWELVDKVLEWLRSGPLADAFIYGESLLPVWFDDGSRSELRAATKAGELGEYISRRHYLIDQAHNMDW